MKWKHSVAAVLAVAMLVLVPFALLAKPEPAQAQSDLVSCEPKGNAIVCTLLGEGVILTVPIPTVKVPGPTIRVPGPTVRVPGPTITLPAPPRATVTVPAAPQPTETVTVRPNNTGRSEAPQPRETVTVTPSPTGQPSPSSATVTPSPEVQTNTETETQTNTETIVKRIALGLLASLVLAGLGILLLWLGYFLGFKGAERSEERSLRGMLETIRGKHS